jgi:hypothetical protein
MEQNAASRVLADLVRGSATRGLGAAAPTQPEGGLFQIPITTAWPRLGPPPWGPGARATLAAPLPFLDDLPLRFDPGPSYALLRDGAPDRQTTVMLVGNEPAPRAVLVDLRERASAADPSTFRPQAAFLFPPGGPRVACYERRGLGVFDLCLEDADGDGLAERRWTRGESGWILDAPVSIPWLSQSYIGSVPDKVRGTACLAILARD